MCAHVPTGIVPASLMSPPHVPKWASFDSTSPYLGAGFDFTIFGQVGMSLDFGVLWQGDPKVVLTADGLLADDPTFMDQLEQERLELVDDMDALKAYPVVSLGFNFNF
jgi:hypothetical protein